MIVHTEIGNPLYDVIHFGIAYSAIYRQRVQKLSFYQCLAWSA